MSKIRTVPILLLVVLVAGLAPVAASAAPASRAAAAESAAGRFIVTLKDGVESRAVAREYDRRPDARASHHIEGVASQGGATWGLDRTDQEARPLDEVYHHTRTGSGVAVYVIDTGIRGTHVDFGGRVALGYDAVTSGGDGWNDCNGHGTHVAGTVGGTTYGIAKAATLVPVRVLGCNGSGTWSGVIAGVDWVTQQHQAANADGAVRASVANMSLGGGANTSVDSAVRRSVDAGVTYTLAAGNDNVDACTRSPARVTEALTIGSTTSSDARSSFSNWGGCVDLFAPGSSITSAWHSSDTATNTISGTSMAAPHAAGVAALYLEYAPSALPRTGSGDVAGTVNGELKMNATAGKLSSVGTGSPNLLLYSLFVPGHVSEPAEPEPSEPTSPGDDPVPALTASIDTVTCSGDTCTYTGSGAGGSGSYQYSWTNNASTDVSATYRYTSTGSKTETFTVSDGSSSASATGTVSCGWAGKGKNKTLSCSASSGSGTGSRDSAG